MIIHKKILTIFLRAMFVFAVIMVTGALMISAGHTTHAFTPVSQEQIFSDAGHHYHFSVPQDWYIENNNGGHVALYPKYALLSTSTAPLCKIELSIFATGVVSDPAKWIAHHLAVDPSIVVSSLSLIQIATHNATGTKWIGTFDGAPMSLVYIFHAGNVYEVAPSLLNGGTDPTSLCANDLNNFLGKLTF